MAGAYRTKRSTEWRPLHGAWQFGSGGGAAIGELIFWRRWIVKSTLMLVCFWLVTVVLNGDEVPEDRVRLCSSKPLRGSLN